MMRFNNMTGHCRNANFTMAIKTTMKLAVSRAQPYHTSVLERLANKILLGDSGHRQFFFIRPRNPHGETLA